MRRLLQSLLLALALAPPADAAEFRSGQTVEVSGAVSDTLFAAGQSVAMPAAIDGTVFVAGMQVDLTGAVSGDAMLAGYHVHVSGAVAKDVMAVAGEFILDGRVAGDVRVASPTVRLERSGTVAGDLAATGEEVVLAGTVAGDAQLAGARVVVSGTVNGTLDVAAAELRLEPGARILGNIRHAGPRTVEVPAGVTVGGTVQYREDDSHVDTGPTLLETLGEALALFLLGLVALWLFPGLVARASQDLRLRPGHSFGVGLAALLLAPLLAVLLMVTLVGIPLGLLLLGLYLVSLPLGLAVAGFGLAEWAARRRGLVPQGKDQPMKRFALFAVLLTLVGLVPVVGGLALGVATCLGLGALVAQVLAGRRTRSYPSA